MDLQRACLGRRMHIAVGAGRHRVPPGGVAAATDPACYGVLYV